MAYEIHVKALEDWTFQVSVHGARETQHTVTVDAHYYNKLTGSRVSPAALVKRSFDFLLARESNTSILSSFDLEIISHYFPEYERVMTTGC